MSTESMRKRAEKLASLWVRRSELLHELEEVDREIDRVQLGGALDGGRERRTGLPSTDADDQRAEAEVEETLHRLTPGNAGSKQRGRQRLSPTDDPERGVVQ